MIIAQATVFKGDDIVGHVRPRRDIFMTTDPDTGQEVVGTNMSIPGTYNSLEGDFYARIEFWDLDTASVTMRVYWNPLVSFVWFGGLSLIIGTLVALWPSRAPSRLSQYAAVPAGARGAGAEGD
jgi:cytochrome c-type biogenesis protein CcmF